jgi:putative endonuclease
MTKEADLTRQLTGRLGETIAEKYLRSRGFSILEKNFRTPFGEIDIIARRDGCVSFLEVKTRTSYSFGPPLSSITETKKKHIIRNCQYYLKLRGLCESPCRIDAIGIKLDTKGRIETLQYVENAIEIY